LGELSKELCNRAYKKLKKASQMSFLKAFLDSCNKS
jgi:hypothetical protein